MLDEPLSAEREDQVMTILSLDRHIECTPGIAGGKPRFAGHRIKVQDVVIWSEHMGQSVDEICGAYFANNRMGRANAGAGKHV